MSTPVQTPPEFGPDFSVTSDKDVPKVNQANPPRAAKRRSFTLGDNKKARSGVRKLDVCENACQVTDDGERTCGCDRSKLVGWYEGIESVAGYLRPALATALSIPGQKAKCANAWIELAEDNDKVRRGILAMVEGGGWGKVFIAHLPLFIAVLPARFVEEFLMARLANMMSSDEAPAMPFPFPVFPADLQTDPNGEQ